MRINFKGTDFSTKSGTSMCSSCEYGHVIQGERLNQSRTFCHRLSEKINFNITSCTHYSERGRMSLPRMYDEAWELAKDKRTGQIGFFTREDMKRLSEKVVRVGKDFDPYE